MKKITDLNLGFSDAENYQRLENKELFNSIFVRNYSLDKLLQPSTYFLIGEKGTGKTAYAVFLNNNFYNTVSVLKFVRETDYQKFISIKLQKQLHISDYTDIWKVIILLLLSKSLDKQFIINTFFKKMYIYEAVLGAIDEYYDKAFSPEIINAFQFVEDSSVSAELISKHLKVKGVDGHKLKGQESRFQTNLMYIQRQFESALKAIKLKNDHILFIDGIDIRPNQIPYTEYIDCVKGLANAAWSLNHDFFSNIKDTPGRFRVVLLLRPDIFNSLDLQNSANKLLDNAVYLDWRTTYPEYRSSGIFRIADTILSAQQINNNMELGDAWDQYFPWNSPSTNPERENDPSFLSLLKISYSRPRDVLVAMQILQEIVKERRDVNKLFFTKDDFNNNIFKDRFSEHLMSGIKDQLSFYYNRTDYETFFSFFSYLRGRATFDYQQYCEAYEKFIAAINSKQQPIPDFAENADRFLQFLYDANILCHIDTIDAGSLFRWCYRERKLSNIAPKVKLGSNYRIHYGLHKALNVGAKEHR